METNDYKKILEIAIGNEVEAYDFYVNAVNKSKDTNLKQIFEELAEEEMKHKVLLESFLKNEKLEMNFHSGADYKVSESVELPKLSSDLTFAEGVALAMKKEEEAMEMYKQFASVSSAPEQKKAFEQLAIMEQGHKAKLEGLYTNAAYIEAW